MRVGSIQRGTVGAMPVNAACLARRRLLCCVALGPLGIRPTRSQPGARLPVISLKLTYANASGIATVHHDAQSLAALGSVQVSTRVPWNREVHVWEGVPIRRLLSALDVVGRSVRLKALNDYQAAIPWEDLDRYDPILAWHQDGQPIPVRAKGPLLVIYPFTAFPELRRAEYTDRSVWHVSEISVE